VPHPLLADRTDEQAKLILTIMEGRLRLDPPSYIRGVEEADGRRLWPNFQYVERMLYRRFNLSARAVLSTLPVLSTGGGDYGWVWTDGHQPPQDATIIGVTIAGMWDLDTTPSSQVIGLFLDMLRIMVGVEHAYEPSAAEVVPVALPTDAARALLRELNDRWDIGPRALDDLREVLKHEPATWHSLGTEAGWTLSPFLRAYGDINAVDRYVERVIDVNRPPEYEPEPLHPSSLALPEAIDYLNLVWTTRTGAPLLRISRAETAVKLSLPCSTADEFESRISALCTILGVVKLPDRDETTLVALREHLIEKLGADESARAVEAIEDLRAVFDLRVWRQHAGTDDRGARGMARLGISLPVLDWGAEWAHVQARTVAALSALREEIETLD
jgi:hypothetical protein